MLASIDSSGKFISSLTKQIPEISTDLKENLSFIAEYQQIYTRPPSGGWETFGKSIGITDESLLKFLANEKYGTKDLANFTQYLKDQNKVIDLQTVKTKALNSVKSIGVNLGMAAIAAGATIVISKVIEGIDNYIHRIERAKEAMAEAQNAIDDSQNKLKEVSSTISENKDRFLELSQGVDKFSHNLHLSEEDYAEYLSISQKLAKLSPSLVYGYDEQGNALLQIGDNAEETKAKLNEVLETQQAITTQTLLDNMNSVAEGIAAEVSETEDELKNLKSELTDLQESHAEVQFDIINNGQFLIDDSAESSKYRKALEDSLNEANIVYTITVILSILLYTFFSRIFDLCSLLQ